MGRFRHSSPLFSFDAVALNPQPLPPRPGDLVGLNPQPLPPRWLRSGIIVVGG